MDLEPQTQNFINQMSESKILIQAEGKTRSHTQDVQALFIMYNAKNHTFISQLSHFVDMITLGLAFFFLFFLKKKKKSFVDWHCHSTK
jgi:hypothetical protein